MQHKLLNVGERAAALLDGGENRSKVVVGENEITGVLGDVGPCTHSDSYIRSLQGGAIVDSIACHSDKGFPTVKRFDHANFRVRSAARDDERQYRQLVNLVVRELVESVVWEVSVSAGNTKRSLDVRARRRPKSLST